MYRKQMKIQSLVCYFLLIASALTFIYSLGIMTDIYNLFYYAEGVLPGFVAGASIFQDMQGFNKQLTTVGIVLILCSVFAFVAGNNTRRKYYFANYLSVGITTVANISASVWIIINVNLYKNQFLTTVDFEALKQFCEDFDIKYTESTFWFDIGYVVCGILILAAITAIANMVWKIDLMKQERAALAEGSEVVA